MTLQRDLSDTPLAEARSTGKVPTENELYVLSVSMLLLEGIGYDELRHRELALLPEQQEQLAQILEYQIPELSSDAFGDCDDLQQRLKELVSKLMIQIDNAKVSDDSGFWA